MSNSYLSSMTTINEKFGDDFSNLPNKFIAYREVILKRKQDALEKVTYFATVRFNKNCGI